MLNEALVNRTASFCIRQRMIDLLPSRVVRAFGSEGTYTDAVSSVNKFNSRLLRERRIRLRLPFVDSQTHIIQMPTQNYLWKSPTQRLIPARHDQVASYARKQWHKKRPHPPAISTTNGISEQQSTASSTKTEHVNGVNTSAGEDDPRTAVRAGSLGKTIENIIC